MAEERRSAPRARISGVRVTYESAAGDHVETEAPNIGRGGLFIASGKPLAVGKRIALEIQIAGELVPWSALGRVVWTREQADGERRPAGMGVKLIDVEDVVVTTIEGLVREREHREPAFGPTAAVPSREPTVLGVGSSLERPASSFDRAAAEAAAVPSASPGHGPQQEPARATPVVALAPSRERTILGVGSHIPKAEALASDEPKTPPAPTPTQGLGAAREPSVVIDLVALDERPPPPSAREAIPASEPPTVVKRRRSGRWIVVVALVAVAAAAAYAFLDRDFERILRIAEPGVAPRPAPPPPQTIVATPPTAAPKATSPSTPAPSAAASANGSASASEARKAPSATPSLTPGRALPTPSTASASQPPWRPVAPPSTPPASPSWRAGPLPSNPSGAKKPTAEDNPY